MSAAERAIAIAESAELLCIVGPTGSGKTDLAIEVCAAVGGEVVSADSVQVYRGFDVGSGKPSLAERAATPHHLVDTHAPDDAIDATTFAELADAAIADVRARGKTPIVVGGTFFWVRALVLGLVDAPRADPEVRARHQAIADERGRAALHAELAKVDPASAARLHENDLVRVSRALEVFELSGRTMSSLQAEHGFKNKRIDARLVGLLHTPEELTDRIARRVDAWLAGGWIEEVRALVAAGHERSRAMGSVGYAEVAAHLRGELSREELRDAIVRSTRVFARKQRTWLNHADVEWLEG
ncbi:MAG: tRNA (adenosine(37)-N6)-dimethylallyltransferase MiaA [Labilithrix sp.]|nr:tRNA (adenosine(37)-N6)-dimethylallyltransferase MiaA [Labilithrix sp.]MCW5815503.1 tRNA (adenosine(37)-N6)-dimethylallyltransferase MiaA [Labilithrix sp.]